MIPFVFPDDACWNETVQAVEFTVEIGDYRGIVRVGRDVFRAALGGGASPESCLQAFHLGRSRFERAAEQKLCRRELTADGNVALTSRDLRPAGRGT